MMTRSEQQDYSVFDSHTHTQKHLREMLLISEVFLHNQDSSMLTFDRIMDVIQEILGFSSCSIHLLEQRGQYVYLAASRGIPEGMPDSVMQAVKTEDLSDSYMQPLVNRKPYRPDEYGTGEEVLKEHEIIEVLKGEIVKIPLVSQDRLIGSVTIIKESATKEWFEAQQQWLAIIGEQLGILIEQMNLNIQFQNSAILLERERVSQELHDNLSQFVGTIRLFAERILESSKAGDTSKIEEDATSLEAISRDAYASVREEMIGLRYISNSDQDIIPTIHDYIERFERQWNIEATLSTHNLHKADSFIKGKGIQLFRIIQESLTNVRRHAQASKITVSIKVKDYTLFCQINDNGTGFDMNTTHDSKLGLRIMRERAVDAGGILRVVSAPGAGTTVSVEFPVTFLD